MMTEAEWRTSVNLGAMLLHVKPWASERKLRLFACACCRVQLRDFNDVGSLMPSSSRFRLVAMRRG
jgi:hypothetical protein